MTTATLPDPVLDMRPTYGATTCSLLELVPLLRVAEDIGDDKSTASIVSAMAQLARPTTASSQTAQQHE
jgi:hypothetical protein